MTDSRSIIIPPFLHTADRVAIVSPSGAVRDSFIDGAVTALATMGFSPVVMPHARGSYGSYAASADDRFSDFSAALLSRDIKAVLCSRGGYGAVHLVERLSRLPLRENAKWIIGFSDISALHALWQFRGIASILGPMGRHLTENPSDHPSVTALRDMLSGSPRPVEAPAHALNRRGEAKAVVRGGNLAVLSSLQATPFRAFIPGSILVIEDINEPIYRLERMLWELKLQGVLAEISGLVCGAFTGTRADSNFASAEEMIRSMTASYGYPVAFGMPVGHISGNMPIMLGVNAQLTVNEHGARLSFLQG